MPQAAGKTTLDPKPEDPGGVSGQVRVGNGDGPVLASRPSAQADSLPAARRPQSRLKTCTVTQVETRSRRIGPKAGQGTAVAGLAPLAEVRGAQAHAAQRHAACSGVRDVVLGEDVSPACAVNARRLGRSERRLIASILKGRAGYVCSDESQRGQACSRPVREAERLTRNDLESILVKSITYAVHASRSVGCRSVK